MHDLHLHSLFSSDSYPSATIENMCNSAIQKGLEGICFTDHIDIDYPTDEGILNFNDYSNAIDEMILKYNNRIDIYKGIELGLQPHIFEENSAFSAKPGIDFIIGSIHVVNKKELYKGDFLQGKSDEDGVLSYLDELKKCISSFSNFDSLGHIDVVRRYLANGEKAFDYNKYSEALENILRTIIYMGKGIEINTSGKRYGLSSFHPLEKILYLYKRLGGEIITLGSDAHSPEDLGYGFKEALDLLSSIGFKYYCIFKKRKPSFIRIE